MTPGKNIIVVVILSVGSHMVPMRSAGMTTLTGVKWPVLNVVGVEAAATSVDLREESFEHHPITVTEWVVAAVAHCFMCSLLPVGRECALVVSARLDESLRHKTTRQAYRLSVQVGPHLGFLCIWHESWMVMPRNEAFAKTELPGFILTGAESIVGIRNLRREFHDFAQEAARGIANNEQLHEVM